MRIRDRSRELQTGRSQFVDEDLTTAAPHVLASLMNVEGDPRSGGWRSDELAEILRHQLDAPLLFDLSAMGADGAAAASGEAGADHAWSFGALFLHPRPPLTMLRLTKRFAKTSDRRSANPLPSQVATVLYYAAIIAALLRHGERISGVDDAGLCEGTAWVLGQAWVTGPLRELFREAQALPALASRMPEREREQ
jgi:hypothetical protein